MMLSGPGIRKIMNKQVEFARHRYPMSDSEMASQRNKILHIPVTVGAVAVAFNIPNIDSLNLSGATLSRIFRGQIAYWNHPKIKSENPHIRLPKLPITPVHRSDSSGTTYIFTFFFPRWIKRGQKMGKGRIIKWFGGGSARGNSGMLKALQRTKGSVGYIATSQLNDKLGLVHVQNAAGSLLSQLEKVTDAADVEITQDTRLSITNTSAQNGYPIAGFTWVLIYQNRTINIEQTNKGRRCMRCCVGC